MTDETERSSGVREERNAITGKVAVKGTGVGVADVLVVIYDIDDDRVPIPNRDDMGRPEGSDGEIWEALTDRGGDRLGSVLTDEDGKFELYYDDSEFRRGDRDEEERPDLVLFVLGPETTRGFDDGERGDGEDAELPTATPLNRQILHYSNVPRTEAGETESYIIHLHREQLKEAGIVLPETEFDRFDPEVAAARQVQNVEKISEFQSLVEDGLFERDLAEAPEQRVAKAAENYDRIRKQTRKLTAVPNSLRKSEFFLLESEGETATDTARRKARERGMANLETYRERLAQNGSLTTTVDPEWPDRWDVDLPAEDETPLQLTETDEAFCSLLHPSVKGYDLTRVRGLLEEQFSGAGADAAETTITFEGSPSGEYEVTVSGTLEKSDAMGAFPNEEDTIADVGNSGRTAAGHVEGGSGRDSYVFTGEITDIDVDPGVTVYIDDEKTTLGGGPDIEVELQERILGQLTDLASVDEIHSGKTKNKLVQLRDTINELELNSGPADVASFHDFHSLQIAFPDVWTETFDSSVKSDIERLYDSHVKLHDEYGVTIPSFVELDEIRDLDAFIDDIERASDSLIETVPSVVTSFWEEATIETWNLLSSEQRGELIRLARGTPGWEVAWEPQSSTGTPMFSMVGGRDALIDQWTTAGPFGVGTEAERHAKGLRILANPVGARDRLTRLMKEIRERLSEPYAFHYFEPDSVNYGLLTTYRQEWQPGPYQVADLVSTIPLAPGEKRKYSKTETIKRSRARKEVENALSTRRGESTQTRRSEAEIIDKATLATNFKLTATGSVDFKIGSASSTSEFSMNQSRESAQTKKDFREAVVKASHEYKNERTLEVSTTEEVTGETTTSGELVNPNNELTVTYLLYELERQYRISERIQQVVPVVLVAQDVPGPHEITESWLLEHEWVLRRVLLDDSFHVALDRLSDSFAGDELSLHVKEENWETQKELVESLQSSLDTQRGVRDVVRERLIGAQSALKRAQSREESQGWFGDAWDDAFAGDSEEQDVDVAEAKVEALRTELEYLDAAIQGLESRLDDERTALNEGTRAYTDALEERANRRTAIDQLRMHVKENILYYMQAIWDHEPPDQRYFRLYHKEVYVPRAGSVQLTLRKADENESTGMLGLKRFTDVDGETYVVEVESDPLPTEEDPANTARLTEIADLDSPLGYKGNYIIFPLKTCTFLTDFMMSEYVDSYFGVRDPDELSEFTSAELRQFIETKRAEIEANEGLTADEKQAEIDALEDALGEIIQQRLANPRRETDLVVVPTGQLYMEALLGDQTLLEDFKLAHRGYDAASARADLREAELENLRYAARLLEEEPHLDDPDADRHVVVEGVDSTAVISANGDEDGDDE